jgi:hypothetical protein
VSGSELASFWVHTITVRTWEGTTGDGDDVLSDPVTVPCFVTRRRRFVRNANGDQVVSESAASMDVTWAATVAVDARVTLDDGSSTTVISAALSTSGPLDLPDRLKVYLA